MRRRFARGGGRSIRRMMRSGIPPLLIRSNELLAEGQFAEAAQGLEQLARAADTRGGRHAARLYLEAGRARILAAQSTAGVDLMNRGFELLAASRLPHRLPRSASRIIADLQERGFTQEAQQITARLKTFAPDFTAVPPEPDPVRRPPLPTRCPGCGAPVRPDEVVWLDDTSAECEYCGSPIRGE